MSAQTPQCQHVPLGPGANFPPTRNGGRHFCQPPSAPSEGSAGVRQLLQPEGHLLLDPGSPAQASLRFVDPNPKTGSSYFRGPSWTNPLSRRLRPEGNRVSRKKDWLFRRLFRLVRLETEVSPHRLSVEIGPSVPSLRGGLGLPSRSPIGYARHCDSLKGQIASPCLWITGISRISPQSRWLPFCSAGPTSSACPNLLS